MYQRRDKVSNDNVRIDFYADTSRLDNDLKAINREIGRLSKERNKINIDSVALERAKADMANITRQLEALGKKRASVQIEIKERNERLTEITREVERLQNESIDLDTRLHNGENVRQELADVQRRITELNLEQVFIEAEKEDLTQEFNKLEKSIEDLNNQSVIIKGTLDGFEEKQRTLAELDRNLTELNGMQVETEIRLEKKEALSGLTAIRDKFNEITNIAGTALTWQGAISGVRSLINNGIAPAIARFDQLNNFPRVLESLGYSSVDAQRSIDMLLDTIVGLPTALNDATAGVQRLTTVFGDVDRATDIFIGLNNAVIASGAPLQRQNSAIEQLMQAFARGRPDAQEWQIFSEVLPAQLHQIALAMDFVDTQEMQNAFNAGAVSMNEFGDALIYLNEHGINGLASLDEQARINSDGIQTALGNLRIGVQIGITEIIGSFNELVAESNTSWTGVQDIILSARRILQNALTGLARAIGRDSGSVVRTLYDVFNRLERLNWEGLFTSWGRTISTVTGVFTSFARTVWTVLRPVLTFLGGGDLGRGIGRLASSLVALKAAKRALTMIQGLDRIFTAFGIGKATTAMTEFKSALSRAIPAINPMNVGLKGMVSNFGTAVSHTGLFGKALKAIPFAWKALAVGAAISAMGKWIGSIRRGSEEIQEIRSNLSNLAQAGERTRDSFNNLLQSFEDFDLRISVSEMQFAEQGIESMDVLIERFNELNKVPIVGSTRFEEMSSVISDMNARLGDTIVTLDSLGNVSHDNMQIGFAYAIAGFERDATEFARRADGLRETIIDLNMDIERGMSELNNFFDYTGLGEAFDFLGESLGFDLATIEITDFVELMRNSSNDVHRMVTNMGKDWDELDETTRQAFRGVATVISNMGSLNQETFVEMTEKLQEHLEALIYAEEQYGISSEEAIYATRNWEQAIAELSRNMVESLTEMRDLTDYEITMMSETMKTFRNFTVDATGRMSDGFQLYMGTIDNVRQYHDITADNARYAFDRMSGYAEYNLEKMIEWNNLLAYAYERFGPHVVNIFDQMGIGSIEGVQYLVENGYDSLYEFGESMEGLVVGGAEDLVDTMRTLGSDVGDILSETFDPATFQMRGADAFEGVIRGIDSMSGDLINIVEECAQSIPNTFDDVLVRRSPSRVMHDAGQDVMQGLINGITSLRSTLFSTVDNIAIRVSSTLSRINASMSINASNIRTQGFNTGGFVEYRASGGLISSLFKPKGTDTVPAMLTPGEYVQRRAAVQKFGQDFMDRVNALDISGAYKAMHARFGSQYGNTYNYSYATTNNVVNNYNNKNVKIDNKSSNTNRTFNKIMKHI